MKLSSYHCYDSHLAVILLRVIALACSLVGVIVFGWTMKELEKVYTDGAGEIYNIFPLAFISYAFLWSFLILLIRLLSNCFIHPAVYITFDLIAFGTLVGFAAAKLEFVASYKHPYSCNYRGTCDGEDLMNVEYFGCAVTLLDGALHLALSIWACWACGQHCIRREQKPEIRINA